MHGFVNAHSPCWLGNHLRKLSRSRLWNRHWNCFPTWCLVSSTNTFPVDSLIVTENYVADDSEIINEINSTADAWIQRHIDPLLTSKSQGKNESLLTKKPSTRLPPAEAFIRPRTQLCWLGNCHRKLCSCQIRNHQRQCVQRWHVDSSAHKVHVDSKIESKKWVAADSESINETAFIAKSWIHPRTQSLLTRKSSPKAE
jgi:hypothetical protein